MLKEEWIAYIIPDDYITVNIASFNSKSEMMSWVKEHLERRLDGYYLDGDRVLYRKTYKPYT